MRQRLGSPLWYREASERERRRFLADQDNHFVMRLKDDMIAVAILFENTIEAIAVTPNFQPRDLVAVLSPCSLIN